MRPPAVWCLCAFLGTLSFAAPARAQQRSRLMTIGFDGSAPKLVREALDHMEAPNWTNDGRTLVYNAGGALFRIPVAGGAPVRIDTGAVTDINNDHGLMPDGRTVVFSAKGHIYLVPLTGGEPKRVSREDGDAAGLKHWWHGVSPDGKTLAFCGLQNGAKDLFALTWKTGALVKLTADAAEDDGPDYTRDGKWIHFNTTRSGTNQIWRMPAAGGPAAQLTRDERVNWFPHPSPDGKWIVYVSFPPGTTGHPRDKDVVLRRMKPDGTGVVDLRALFGGQGTLNVPPWSPDSKRFAFVEYTRDTADAGAPPR